MMMLRAEKICKRHRKALILHNLSLSVDTGESIAVVGPSGTGKSTLLHILGTLEKPSSGTIFLAGNEVSQKTYMKMRNQHIGFIFQNFNLFEDCSVWENAIMPSRILRKDRKLRKQQRSYTRDLLTQVGLHEHKDRIAKHLSGGEKQRVAIVRALCNRPELILADEPSGNLDEATSLSVHTLLIDSVKSTGGALIIVTHDPVLANLCDRKYLLKEGKLLRFT